MFKWLKRLLHRPRLIERYEDLEAIIDAYNALIQKTNAVRDYLPPKYLLSRYNAIQDAEERAIAAYWRNKNRKQDKWYKRPTAEENSAMSDIVREKSEEQPPEELAATPPVEALPTTETPPTGTQALEQAPKDNVIEIHINN